MLLGAVTYNVLKDWDLETIIKNLDAAGRERVKARFARSKVRLLSYGSTSEFHSPDPAERRKHIESGKQFVDLAHDTGAWGVKVRPNGFPAAVPRETTIKNIAAGLRELGDY